MVQIYCLFDTLTNAPFYVGASRQNIDDTLRRHLRCRKPFKSVRCVDITYQKECLIWHRIENKIEIKIIVLDLVVMDLAKEKEREYYNIIKGLGYKLYNDTTRFYYGSNTSEEKRRKEKQ